MTPGGTQSMQFRVMPAKVATVGVPDLKMAFSVTRSVLP
jgi:hypothetical protein